MQAESVFFDGSRKLANGFRGAVTKVSRRTENLNAGDSRAGNLGKKRRRERMVYVSVSGKGELHSALGRESVWSTEIALASIARHRHILAFVQCGAAVQSGINQEAAPIRTFGPVG